MGSWSTLDFWLDAESAEALRQRRANGTRVPFFKGDFRGLMIVLLAAPLLLGTWGFSQMGDSFWLGVALLGVGLVVALLTLRYALRPVDEDMRDD